MRIEGLEHHSRDGVGCIHTDALGTVGAEGFIVPSYHSSKRSEELLEGYLKQPQVATEEA